MNETLQTLCNDSLGGDGQTMEPAWRLALEANFGSVAQWAAQFGAGAGTGTGWALLLFQPNSGALINACVAEAGTLPAGAVPLLALPRDALAERRAQVDWSRVYGRYRQAVHDASEPWGAQHAEVAGALLVDVRRAGVYAQAQTMLPGARWCDPAAVAQWAAELPTDREVLVYCVYGHEVGRSTALRLRAAGVRARYLQGGIDGWQAAGLPLAVKPGGAGR